MAQKRKPGRPKVPVEQHRRFALHVMVTAEERRLIKQAAEADDQSLSGWARAAMLAAARRR